MVDLIILWDGAKRGKKIEALEGDESEEAFADNLKKIVNEKPNKTHSD